jgi:hypothetical protein
MVLDYFIGGTDIETASTMLQLVLYVDINFNSPFYLFIYLVDRTQSKTQGERVLIVSRSLPAYKCKSLTVFAYL